MAVRGWRVRPHGQISVVIGHRDALREPAKAGDAAAQHEMAERYANGSRARTSDRTGEPRPPSSVKGAGIHPGG